MVGYNGEYGGRYLTVDGVDVFDYGNGDVYVGVNLNNWCKLEKLKNKNPKLYEKIKLALATIGV